MVSRRSFAWVEELRVRRSVHWYGESSPSSRALSPNFRVRNNQYFVGDIWLKVEYQDGRWPDRPGQGGVLSCWSRPAASMARFVAWGVGPYSYEYGVVEREVTMTAFPALAVDRESARGVSDT